MLQRIFYISLLISFFTLSHAQDEDVEKLYLEQISSLPEDTSKVNQLNNLANIMMNID